MQITPACSDGWHLLFDTFLECLYIYTHPGFWLVSTVRSPCNQAHRWENAKPQAPQCKLEMSGASQWCCKPSFQLTCWCFVYVGVKPYACSMCDMRFFQRYHLARHSLTHTGMRLLPPPPAPPITYLVFSQSQSKLDGGIVSPSAAPPQAINR